MNAAATFNPFDELWQLAKYGQFKLLWTDGLLFLLCACVLGFFFYARRREYLIEPWRVVGRNGAAMASVVVLAFYLFIGIIDSIHFRPMTDQRAADGQAQYSAEVLSVLDALLKPLRVQVERSYSAPLATFAFSKETLTNAEGEQYREYPRLQYAGAHLDDPAQAGADILLKTLSGAAVGLSLWATIAATVVFFVARRGALGYAEAFRRVSLGKTAQPWRVILATLAVVLMTASAALCLAHSYHILGTDKVGQDVFYQALKSIRTGLAIGTLTTLIMLPFAVMLGMLAGYFRGWIDDVIQYLYTTLNSIPGVLLIAAAVLILQAYINTHPDLFATDADRSDLRLVGLCAILGITSWTGLCRLLRGEALKLRELDYVQAATAFGVRHRSVLLRHLLPNLMHIVLITVVLDFSGLVLAEAVLSYVGVGVDPTMNSWGNMINGARLEMAREPMVWWSLLAAFLFMFFLVLAANIFSDAVRDALDPRLRHRQ